MSFLVQNIELCTITLNGQYHRNGVWILSIEKGAFLHLRLEGRNCSCAHLLTKERDQIHNLVIISCFACATLVPQSTNETVPIWQFSILPSPFFVIPMPSSTFNHASLIQFSAHCQSFPHIPLKIEPLSSLRDNVARIPPTFWL
jgi:hypothetical protein